ncbi:DUF2474 family protein [Vibrio sp. WJH972]
MYKKTKQLCWLMGIWLASVAALTIVGFMIRLVIG